MAKHFDESCAATDIREQIKNNPGFNEGLLDIKI